jgi:hypothetical protein
MATKSAVRVHHTPTTENDWDGPAAERRLPDNADVSRYRRLFAWIDTTHLDAKTAHKFPHHEVSARGNVGAANVKACTSAIGILNGGRGGADIPKADRKSVYGHLAAHLRDGGEEPAPLKA